MLIIGEKINATRKPIAAALADRNATAIERIASEQVAAGADRIDVNGGDADASREADNLVWLIQCVHNACDAEVCVDTARPDAARRALLVAGEQAMLNSISLESDRIESMLPVVEEFGCCVVALLMSDAGFPRDVDSRLRNAEALIDKLTGVGRSVDEIFIDPCLFPVAAGAETWGQALKAIRAIRRQWPEVHLVGGISNVSHGLPKRRFINIAATVQAIEAGMDSAIIDPGETDMMAMIRAAEALAGRDEMCMGYVKAASEGRLG
jgi:5-methyltetrahydrofolate--homocysteine methyltransferase